MKKECSDPAETVNTLKNILKKILPVPILKEAFLVYNKVRIRTVDKFLFPEYIIPKEKFTIYRQGYPFRENNIDLSPLADGELKSKMQRWNDWTQEEFLLVMDVPCVIEPDHGWAIVGKNKLVYYSLGISRTLFQPKPGLFKLRQKKQTQHLSKAISLRDTGEENYFHFFNDVLSKLFFLQKQGIDVTQFPIIIAQKLWDKAYFQYYSRHSSFLQSLQWIRQDQQYIECDAAIFCKPLTHIHDIWKAIVAPLVIEIPTTPKKVFLTRSKSRLRFMENSEAIEAIAIREGFIIVDTDRLSPAEQVQLFSLTAVLVGIHGAGLTNMVFRQGRCKILEIFPSDELGYLPFHYIMLAALKNFPYNAIIGEPGRVKYSGGFYLSPEKFERALTALSTQ